MRLSEEELARIMRQEGYREVDHAAYASSETLPDVGKKKRHKYGARKTEVDGIMFDSAAEAKRYGTLKLLESVGEINGLRLQPEFVLQGEFQRDGKKYRAVKYKADFIYETKDGVTIVEDVKGLETPVFKLKWKMLLHKAEYGSWVHIKFVIVNGKDA